MKPRRSSTISTAAVCVASLGLGGSGPAPEHLFAGELQTATGSVQGSRSGRQDAIRLVTFNAKFLPLVFTSNARRATDLSQRIQHGDYDIVGLNEVFDENAREILVTRLSAVFPYVVERVGGGRGRQDSGLMLLSRFPFVPTSVQPARARDQVVDETVSRSVSFHEYSDCAWTDCLAAKGVGHVRLRIAEANVDLFFTHLQATYTHHGQRRQRQSRRVRAVQLQEMASFAAQVRSYDPTHSTTVILLGDMNVPGRPAKQGGRPPPVESPSEWDFMMQALRQPMDGQLYDAWYEHGSAGDSGLTYPASRPRARFDYILAAPPSHGPALCIRDVTRDTLLATPGDTTADDGYLSDHFGVRVDFVIGTDTCAGEVS